MSWQPIDCEPFEAILEGEELVILAGRTDMDAPPGDVQLWREYGTREGQPRLRSWHYRGGPCDHQELRQ